MVADTLECVEGKIHNATTQHKKNLPVGEAEIEKIL